MASIWWMGPNLLDWRIARDILIFIRSRHELIHWPIHEQPGFVLNGIKILLPACWQPQGHNCNTSIWNIICDKHWNVSTRCLPKRFRFKTTGVIFRCNSVVASVACFWRSHFQKLCKSIVAAPDVDRNKNWHDMFHLWNARVRTSVATAQTNPWPHITCNFCELNKTCWHFACAPVGSMFQSHGCSKCAPAATYVGVQISITLLLRELRIIKTKQHWGFGMGLTLGFVCRPVERT